MDSAQFAAAPWERPFPGWDATAAEQIARHVAERSDLSWGWDPPDEEWINLVSSGAAQAMISALFPLAFAVPRLTSVLACAAPILVVIEVTDFYAEELRASPDLLRATLLRLGWADDFDTNAFCASDLFVESV